VSHRSAPTTFPANTVGFVSLLTMMAIAPLAAIYSASGVQTSVLGWLVAACGFVALVCTAFSGVGVSLGFGLAGASLALITGGFRILFNWSPAVSIIAMVVGSVLLWYGLFDYCRTAKRLRVDAHRSQSR
jgi:hypothetical protein